jgi:hypothetical protein
MARALSPEEAEVFNEANSPEQNLMMMGNSTGNLSLPQNEALESLPELGFLFGNNLPKP